MFHTVLFSWKFRRLSIYLVELHVQWAFGSDLVWFYMHHLIDTLKMHHLWRAMGQREILQVLTFGRQEQKYECNFQIFSFILTYMYIGHWLKSWMRNYKSYCVCVCVCVQFCFPAKVEWPGLILMVWKISPVSRGFPLLDSHNREANQLNRFCVAPFASAYLVHWLLCNCYYFELLLLRRSTSVSTTHSDYIRDSFAIEVYSYQDVFLLFYK